MQMARAREQGKAIGRPKVNGKVEKKVRKLRAGGMGIKRIAKEAGVAWQFHLNGSNLTETRTSQRVAIAVNQPSVVRISQPAASCHRQIYREHEI